MDNNLPGFHRFYPTEEDLLSFYLHNKLNNLRAADIARAVTHVNVFNYDPWVLLAKAGELCRRDKVQWLFFYPRPNTNASLMDSQTTTQGFWLKASSWVTIYSSTNRQLGIRNTWQYCTGEPQRRPFKRSEWIINEYLLYEELATATSFGQIRKLVPATNWIRQAENLSWPAVARLRQPDGGNDGLGKILRSV